MNAPHEQLRAIETTERVLAALRLEPQQDEAIRNLIRSIEERRAALLVDVAATDGLKSSGGLRAA